MTQDMNLTTGIKMLVRNASSSILRVTLLSSLFVTVPLFAADGNDEHNGHDHQQSAPARLIQIVRDATRPFIDINALAGTDYAPAFGCVSGPDHGAMGVHYISGSLASDTEVDPMKPEALIYEPAKGGGMRLVGVEYIVDVKAWKSNPDHKAPPMLEGQAFQIVGSPNRYGLDPFYELHVWAWRDNPNGAFVDWNNQVTCENQ